MRRLVSLSVLATLCAATLSPALRAAEWGSFEYDFEANSKSWKEVAAQLPAAPLPANLIEIKLDSSTRNSLFIDAASLSVGDDDVIRYTAIIRTPSGAQNVSFEGLRCDNGERKLYAFGRTTGADAGTWSRNRFAKWEPIKARLAGGYHRELFFHYLCTDNAKRDVPTLLRLLKTGGVYDQ